MRSNGTSVLMLLAPASRLFSNNSFVAVARSMTTCPEHIRCTEAGSICFIVPPISSTSHSRPHLQILLNVIKVKREVPPEILKCFGITAEARLNAGFIVKSRTFVEIPISHPFPIFSDHKGGRWNETAFLSLASGNLNFSSI